MAKESRTEVAWASFCHTVRFSTHSSETPAVARSESVRLYMDDIRGVPHLVIEDPAIPFPAAIPWTNVASVGWFK